MSRVIIFPREDQKYSSPVAVLSDSIPLHARLVKVLGYRMSGSCFGAVFSLVLVFVSFHLELFSVGLTVDDNLVTGMGQTIQDGIGHDGIGKECRPIVHRAI
jgi:hypothetical protein